jgi:hypothetical protein
LSSGGASGNNNHRIHIDPVKVREAISKIYEITKKNEDDHEGGAEGNTNTQPFKLEYDKKPIKYEYIDAHNINSYDRK